MGPMTGKTHKIVKAGLIPWNGGQGRASAVRIPAGRGLYIRCSIVHRPEISDVLRAIGNHLWTRT
jgi:hypothetical protein